jgi:hypothetical protein
MRRRARLACLLIGAWSRPFLAGAETLPRVPPIAVPRVPGPVTMDGRLSDPVWREAALLDRFWDVTFNDNRVPIAATRARIMHDDRYLYIGVECDDPEPGKIRAPYVERDEVLATQDNVAIFLDTRNDRRAAYELRVNPRGSQADGVYNEADQNEDFSPDFYYDTAARVTDHGWEAEFRIPFSSLRYRHSDRQAWGIRVWRNYPREFRYGFFSSPFPIGSNCFVCHLHEIDLEGLPSSGHLVAAPYASGQDVATAPAPGEPLGPDEQKGEVGIDLKWTPGAATALDATINPDFSQIEADVAQITVNQRFALFYPEKRPFFLEGTDLFALPFQAVYTRTITSPRWGGRATGKHGSTSYTLLTVQDRGGGSVVIPGPTNSSLAPQDYRSLVTTGRVRTDFGASFVGLLYTGREIDASDGGGHNRVFGPDFQWRPDNRQAITGQMLWSRTEEPNRPDLAPEWNGARLESYAGSLQWARQSATFDHTLRYADVGANFRDDQGFVPQVGYREGYAEVGYTFYPTGLLNRLRPSLVGDYKADRDGALLGRRFQPGLSFAGQRNLQAQIGVAFETLRTGGTLLPRTQATFAIFVDPSRRVPRISLTGSWGGQIDLANVRTGTGPDLTLSLTLRPTDHLTLDAVSALSWVDVETAAGARGRLFTAQVQRLKATYNFTPRFFVRLIGQYVATERDPALYETPVPEREATFTGSALLSYRLNWQTACFVGYGDDRVRPEAGGLARTSRQLFVKISYAFQR